MLLAHLCVLCGCMTINEFVWRECSPPASLRQLKHQRPRTIDSRMYHIDIDELLLYIHTCMARLKVMASKRCSALAWPEGGRLGCCVKEARISSMYESAWSTSPHTPQACLFWGESAGRMSQMLHHGDRGAICSYISILNIPYAYIP